MPQDMPAGRGDERKLTQVLLNLVANAIKFTDEGEVAIKVARPDGAFSVSVHDTGPGIPKADQERLFEEFQQVDNSITKSKGGTRLGLAISRRIIELHGGRLWVDFEPWERFDLHLRNSIIGRSGEAIMSKRILLVEDEADNMQILRDLLAADYTIDEAENGEQALASVAKQRPDLILMDIQLPVMDGYEATRRLKADPALRAIPIIAITSYALGEDEKRARAAGCDDFVAKPYSPRFLLAKVRDHLSKK